MPSTSEIGYQLPKLWTDTGLWWFAPDDEDNPDLRWPKSVGVFDRMRREDAQIASILRAVTLPIRRTAWSIDGTGCDPVVTQFVADAVGLPVKGAHTPPLRMGDRFSWSDHLRLVLTALPFGHAFFEQVYRQTGDGLFTLHKLGWRPPRTISGVNVDSDGGLVSICQYESEPIPVANLVAYVNDREGGNWLGQSILRPAYGPWILKQRALQIQSTTLERNGLGIPVYESPPTPEGMVGSAREDEWLDQQAKAGEDLVSNLRGGENAGASIPNGAKLSLLAPNGTLPDANTPISYYDEQIARSVLAHFLNLGTQTGSWALGTTFADFFTMSLQTVAEWVADVANRHVIEDLVDINFGETVPAPRLVFEEIGSQQPATAEAMQSLVQTGVVRPDDVLENYVRERYGLPPADPATIRAAVGVQQSVAGGSNDSPEGGSDGEKASDEG